MKLDNLKTKFIGRNLIYYETIDSTQLEAWRVALNDTPNGSLIIADYQTNGQGTHGRRWISSDIAFSILLYPDCNIENLNGITIAIAETIKEVFDNLYNIKLDIKYPNDLMCNQKKVSGILTETKLFGENVKCLVIGVGINLNNTIIDESIKNIATSIVNETNIKCDKCLIISEICNLLEEKIIKMKNG